MAIAVPTARELEAYLHGHIPLSQAMRVAVLEAARERVVLAAPLAPNINHHETLFGGSGSAIATLAAWCVLNIGLAASGLQTRLVIQRNTMQFELPVGGDFTASAAAPPVEAWAVFVRLLERRGRARISAAATLWYAGRESGRFVGDFVAHATTNLRANLAPMGADP
jgi:thioesterase domain-containing protein